MGGSIFFFALLGIIALFAKMASEPGPEAQPPPLDSEALKAAYNKKQEAGEEAEKESLLREPQPISLAGPIPGEQITWRRLNLWFRSRQASEDEFYAIWGGGPGQLEIHFPVPRCLLNIDLIFSGCGFLPLFSLTFSNGPEKLDIPWAGSWYLHPQGSHLLLAIGDPRPVAKITIGLPGNAQETGVQVRPKLLRRKEPDRDLVGGAVRALNLGQNEMGLERFRTYERDWSAHNPVVMYNLAKLMVATGRFDLAQYHAVRLLTHYLLEPGLEMYRFTQDQCPWQHSAEEVKGSRTRVEDWKLDDHHGLVTLDARRRFVVGLNGNHWELNSEVTGILRKAAARKLRRVLIPLEEGRSFLIHSEVRIFRRDGKVDKLPGDRFSMVNAEDDNPFIPVARKRAGQWILPDLEVGDAVELNYSMMHRDRGEDPASGLFLLSNFSTSVAPILRGRLEILNPNHQSLEFASRNCDPKPEITRDHATGFQKYAFARYRVLPRFNSGTPYEKTFLNPLVACRTKGEGWSDTAARLFKSVDEALAAHGQPPAPLLAAMAGCQDREETLARAFYWVRDRIKYGSLVSGNLMIGSELRAANLVAAGIGDCKDKSFLLALACRHLGLDFDFVLVSSDNGLIVDELPADQFDHIILRARVGDRWFYLDASAEQATFGNVPFGLQGLRGLIPRNGGELIEIPHDPSHRNRILAFETVRDIRDGWLATAIDLTLEGNPARYFDEAWKTYSLNSAGSLQAAESAFRLIYPGLVVDEFERKGDTSHSDVCRYTCLGRRGRLMAMGDHRLVALKWTDPGLATEWIRRLDIRDQFVFPFCHEVQTRIGFTDDALASLADVSRAGAFRTAFGAVEEEISREVGSLVVRRGITVSARQVSQDHLEDLPGFLAASEDALGVVTAFA